MKIIPKNNSAIGKIPIVDIGISKTNRNTSIDFVKGMLVLSMVVYHSLNYAMNNSFVFRYLRFIASGFILVSGFLIVNVISRKYGINYHKLARKLILRGIKLIIFFTLINIIINLLVRSNYGNRVLDINLFFQNAFSIYLPGNSNIAAFEILLPIGYVFCLAPLFLFGTKLDHFLLSGITILLLFSCIFWNANSINLNYIAFGITGMALGQIPLEFIGNGLIRYRYGFFAIFVIYIIVATFGVQPFIMVLWGTISTLSIFYMASTGLGENNSLKMHVTRLGRYSLFAYVSQIVFLQIIIRGARFFEWNTVDFWLPFSLTLFLTIASVIFLDKIVNRFIFAKRIYRVIFN